MFTLTLTAFSTSIDLLNVRNFLIKANLAPTLDQDYIHYWIFYPFNKKFDEKAIDKSITLQSIGNKQVRHYNVDEIIKNWGIIINQFITKHTQVTIHIYQSECLGEGSKLFFNLMAQNSNIKVIYYPFQSFKDQMLLFNGLDLTEEEKWILDITQFPSIISDLDQQTLFDYAHRYLAVGDGWACLNINTLLLSYQPKFLNRIYEDLCMSYKAFKRYYEAEFFVKKLIQISTGKDKIMASYTYLMLLSRYHAPYFKDYEKALTILEETHQYIQSLDPLSEEFLDLRQHEIYNPNGRAYVYFKQKRYHEVIEVLLEGLDFIDKNVKLKLPLYHSLLVYNLAQTYKKLRNHEKIFQTYKYLLDIDPLEVVYLIDFAVYCIDLKDFDKAKQLINEALSISANLPIAHAALGYLYLQQERLNESEIHYKKAFDVLPNNLEYLYNYAYILSLQEKYQAVRELLDKNDWQESDKKAWLQSSKSYYIDFLFLYVEALTYCNQVQQAYQILKNAHSRFINHPHIEENLKLLEENFSNVLQKNS